MATNASRRSVDREIRQDGIQETVTLDSSRESAAAVTTPLALAGVGPGQHAAGAVHAGGTFYVLAADGMRHADPSPGRGTICASFSEIRQMLQLQHGCLRIPDTYGARATWTGLREWTRGGRGAGRSRANSRAAISSDHEQAGHADLVFAGRESPAVHQGVAVGPRAGRGSQEQAGTFFCATGGHVDPHSQVLRAPENYARETVRNGRATARRLTLTREPGLTPGSRDFFCAAGTSAPGYWTTASQRVAGQLGSTPRLRSCATGGHGDPQRLGGWLQADFATAPRLPAALGPGSTPGSRSFFACVRGAANPAGCKPAVSGFAGSSPAACTIPSARSAAPAPEQGGRGIESLPAHRAGAVAPQPIVYGQRAGMLSMRGSRRLLLGVAQSGEPRVAGSIPAAETITFDRRGSHAAQGDPASGDATGTRPHETRPAAIVSHLSDRHFASRPRPFLRLGSGRVFPFARRVAGQLSHFVGSTCSGGWAKRGSQPAHSEVGASAFSHGTGESGAVRVRARDESEQARLCHPHTARPGSGLTIARSPESISPAAGARRCGAGVRARNIFAEVA